MSNSRNGPQKKKRGIRFPCPHCGIYLRAPVEHVGRSISCSACQERATVPPEDELTAGDFGRAIASQPPPPVVSLPVRVGRRVKQFFSSMSTSTRLILLGCVGLGLGCLVLMYYVGMGPEGSAAPLRHSLMIAACLSVIASLATLYGHATCCPACRRWYAKRDDGSELVDSGIYYRETDEAADRGDRSAVLKVLTYHHKHRCSHCGHQWTTTSTDRYEGTVRKRLSAEGFEGSKRVKRYRID